MSFVLLWRRKACPSPKLVIIHVTPGQFQESAEPSWRPCVDSGFFAGPKELCYQDSEGVLETPSPPAIKGGLVPPEIKPGSSVTPAPCSIT